MKIHFKLFIFSLLVVGLIFSPNNLSELNNLETNEAEGRSGPDAEVVSILSPRATTTDLFTGEKMHTLNAGEDVTFEAFITNDGNTAITEMGVSLTVYLAENGTKGMIAKDAAGNDLSWTNGDVVCDDTFVCPWSTLDAGANLANGKYTMTYQGSPAIWTPSTGDYVIAVEVTAVGDSDPGNNGAANDHFVSVVDWNDIIVDLAWDSGKEVEGGSGDKAFTLTVATGGSSSWSARSIILEMVVLGTLESAVDSSGADLMGTTQVSGFGVSGMTETFRHAEDDTNVTNGTRFVIDFDTESAWNGVISPDMTGDSGDYSIEVNLISYVMYGQLPDCEETVTTTNAQGDREDRTFIHYCEVSASTDGDAATSEDLIEGKVQTYHDIGVTGLSINQGYTVDENGNAIDIPTMPGMTSGPLNPAWSSVQASVRHMGSDLGTTYDWEVTFDIENLGTGVIHTEVADSCTFGFGEPYTHMMLGDDPLNPGTAFENGEACIMFEFAPGVYTITATASMTNIEQVDDGTGTMVDKYSDMSSSNDDTSIFKIAALNNRPSVDLTLENENPGSIVIGPEGIITLAANAMDADDEGGLELTYIWTHPGMPEGENGTVIPSECNGVGPQYSNCVLIALDSSWAGGNTYSVRVSDSYGSFAQGMKNVEVWNHKDALATSASGIEMLYELTYRGSNEFGISITDSTSEPYTQDLTLFGYAGEYTSEAILDYQPSAVYMAQDVHAQSMSIYYDATPDTGIAPTSAFWVSSNGLWSKLDSTFTVSSNDGTIAIDMSNIGQVLAQGEIVLMGGELQIVEKPNSNPKDANVEATKGGDITATWSYAGTTVPGFDWLSMEICDSDGNCDTTQENTTKVGHSLSGQTETVHGLTYTFTLQVCNGGGCNDISTSDNATADKMVDGDAVAEDMTVANKDGADAWTVSWTVGGTDSSDVAGWEVCWTDYSWSMSGDMPTTCVDAGDATTTDVNHPGGSGMKHYYFTAVPYDDKLNMDNAVPGTDIMLEHATAIDPCVEDPTAEDCEDISEDSTESGTVPTWTWGVIIGLVVVAFVAGAFILSRGGEGKDDKDWDY
jgi:hypothetical protein